MIVMKAMVCEGLRGVSENLEDDQCRRLGTTLLNCTMYTIKTTTSLGDLVLPGETVFLLPGVRRPPSLASLRLLSL